jgi:hypothetical protein
LQLYGTVDLLEKNCEIKLLRINAPFVHGYSRRFGNIDSLAFPEVDEETSAYAGNRAAQSQSFFERAARTKADNTKTKSTTPSIVSGILKAGSEWRTAVVGRPAK